MYTISTWLNRFSLILLACSLPLWFMACGGSDDGPGPDPDPDPVEDTTAVDNGMFYKLHRVENFAGDTEYDGPVDGKRAAIYFSLENKEGVKASYQKSNLWDLSFSGIANSDIDVNNGSVRSSLGYGATGVGAIYITDRSFEEVTDIPDESQFRYRVSLDENGAFGNGLGWALYDWGGEIVADASYEKQHVAYALGNPLTLNNGKNLVRTLVVKTAKGYYAKIKMISVYKDISDPENMMRNSTYPYFTFEYVLVPGDSETFEIR
ncbi:HmuY family protein [Sinomicrobium oceani]|nr:HmuY family protein [Sinomicrobium oceani]